MHSRLLRFVFGFAALLVFAFRAGAATVPEGQTLDPANQVTDDQGWFSFDPMPDPFTESPIDLRFLNEKFAGEHGFIGVKDGHFVHSGTGNQCGSGR
jgi:hypothetical protein